MTRSSVGHSLGLTAKKANRNLSAFAAKYGIREAFAQQGKAQIKVRIILPLSFENTQSNAMLCRHIERIFCRVRQRLNLPIHLYRLTAFE